MLARHHRTAVRAGRAECYRGSRSGL